MAVGGHGGCGMAAVDDRVGFGDGKDVGENLCGWFLPLKNSIYVPSTFPI